MQRSIKRALRNQKHLHIVQVGANDGVSYDLVSEVIENSPCTALLAEPVPYIFEKLRKNYAAKSNVTLKEVAVSDNAEHNVLPFYCFQPRENFPFNSAYSLWGSFDESHLEKFKPLVENYDVLKTCIQVPVLEINQLIAGSKFPKLDLLQVDAEGWDVKLLSALDVERWKPGIIRFEHIHAPKTELFLLLDKFSLSGYETFSVGLDTIAVHNSLSRFFKTLHVIKLLHAEWLKPSKV